MDLRDLAKGLLEAEGYAVSLRGGDLLVGSRPGIAGDTEFIYVWVLAGSDPRSRASREGALLARFQEANEAHPGARKYLLVESTEGFHSEFTRGAFRWYGVNIRVPAHFFDTAFTWEERPDVASPVKDLSKEGACVRDRRAIQPYSREGAEDGPDLLPVLLESLRSRSPEHRPIRIVVGPGGMGKSVLFATLFSELYERFQEDKRRQILSPRPFPLVPAHITKADAPVVRSILRAFLQTEFARPLDVKVFEWRLTHGMAMWLLDGLDEVIGQDARFFDDLLDLLTIPRAEPPIILICVRDSLLATNEAFREFCHEFADHVELYRLQPWRIESKRQLAEIMLRRDGEDFLRALGARPSLDALASTPYYCWLLAEEFERDRGSLQREYSEPDLVGRAVARIIDREIGKGVIREDVTPRDEVLGFIEAVAAEDMEEGFSGVPVDEARVLAGVVLSGDLEDEARERFVAQMTQLALFSSGRLGGRIQFAQEILEQYMLGRWFVRLLGRPESLLRGLGVRSIPSDWLTLRVLAEGIRAAGAIEDLLSLATQAVGRGVMFKNLVQVAALAADGPELLRGVPFEGQDLSGVVFRDLDLSGVSFRGCDLTDVQFRSCLLRGAHLEDAILSNTSFDELADDALAGAETGDLSRFLSMRVEGGRLLADAGAARRWFDRRTGVPGKVVEPCLAAQQLRHQLLKFVRPDGSARRSWVDWKALASGRRVTEDPLAVVRAAIRYGYLVERTGRPQVERPTGDKYSEAVAFASRLVLSSGLRAVLDDVCATEGCPHVPPSRILAA